MKTRQNRTLRLFQFNRLNRAEGRLANYLNTELPSRVGVASIDTTLVYASVTAFSRLVHVLLQFSEWPVHTYRWSVCMSFHLTHIEMCMASIAPDIIES